jgi:hypothetical protein
VDASAVFAARLVGAKTTDPEGAPADDGDGAKKKKPKRQTPCPAYNSKQGCLAGPSCPQGHFCSRCLSKNKGRVPHPAHGCAV